MIEARVQSHMRMPVIVSLAFTGVSTLAAPVHAQEIAFRLGSPAWELADPRSEIVGVAALRDGRVLIADRRERLLYVASRDGAAIEALGRNGQGPGEYAIPHAITRGRADTLYVYAGNTRYTRITGDGRIVDDLPIPTEFLRAGGLAAPRGIDDAGRIHWQGDVVGQTAEGFKRNEVQNIRRWTPGVVRLDTVASLRDHAAEMHHHRFHPLAERDVFVVAPDGRVGVLSAREYRLRWYRDGRVVSEGPPIPFEPIRVTAAERAAYRRARAQALSGMARVDGGGSRGAEPSPQAIRQMEVAFTDEMFPAALPPFVEQGALLSPGGEVWVVRSAPTGARAHRVDILAPDGRRRGHLTLPEGRRLVALEAAGVFLARVDEDGLEWLERYAWPEGLR